MFVQRKTDASVARAELKRNLTVFAAACVLIRATPYVLELLSKK